MLRITILIATLCLSACTGATWQKSRVEPGYAAPPRVGVVLSLTTGGANLDEAVKVLQASLLEELKVGGIDAVVVHGEAAAPNVHITIVQWDPGSRAARYFIGYGSGEGAMTGEVAVVLATGRAPALEGEVRGWVRGGFFGGSSMNSAEQAGKAIARAIATGKPYND